MQMTHKGSRERDNGTIVPRALRLARFRSIALGTCSNVKGLWRRQLELQLILLQSNLSNMDTEETKQSVRIREVSV